MNDYYEYEYTFDSNYKCSFIEKKQINNKSYLVYVSQMLSIIPINFIMVYLLILLKFLIFNCFVPFLLDEYDYNNNNNHLRLVLFF